MSPLDPALERMFLGIAHALFMNRLHLLRLTEIVRHGIEPDNDGGNLEVPPELDAELKQQAIDYVLTCLPREYAGQIKRATQDWLRPD